MKHPKQEIILSRIDTYLSEVLAKAEAEGKIDYFKLEIVNHNGSLQMDMVFRDKTKVY